MAALPYIQLYVADYLADTIHLTTEEHGAYMLLIFNYWQTGKPLPANRLASISKLNERWTDVEQTLAEFFELDENDHWYHERIEMDLNKVKSKSIQASKAGKLSAAKRAASKAIDSKDNSNGRSFPVERKSNHTDTDTDTEADTDTKTEAIKPKPKATKGSRLSQDFLPNEWKLFCNEKRPDLNPESTFDGFKDYWIGVAGAKGVKLDWFATWRNWIRNQKAGRQSSNKSDENTRFRESLQANEDAIEGYCHESKR